MCTNRIHLKSHGQDLYLDCGSCPSCLVKKANANCRKINYNYEPNYNYFFVTFTYNNSYVPYVLLDDLKPGSRSVRVYRALESLDIELKEPLLISDINSVNNSKYHLHRFPFKNCIGVLLWSDLTNFFRRLRKFLYKCYGKTYFLSYYAISELGETFFRPHFHVLFKTDLSKTQLSEACFDSWEMCDWHSVPRAFEEAINPASYLSLYLTCNSSLPSFHQISAFKPRKSHSLFFGQCLPDFTLSSVFHCAEQHSLTYFGASLRKNGITLFDYIPLPTYIVYKYFPKFKGFGKLSYSEFLLFCKSINRPDKRNSFYESYPPISKKEYLSPTNSTFNKFDVSSHTINDYYDYLSMYDLVRRLRLTYHDIKDIVNKVNRVYLYAKELNVDFDYYLKIWYSVPVIIFSYSLKQSHFNLSLADYSKFYFNYDDLLTHRVRAPTLDCLVDTFDSDSFSDVSSFDTKKNFYSISKLSKFNKNNKQKTHLL